MKMHFLSRETAENVLEKYSEGIPTETSEWTAGISLVEINTQEKAQQI